MGFCQRVQNCCRERYAKLGVAICSSLRDISKFRVWVAFSPPPPTERGLKPHESKTALATSSSLKYFARSLAPVDRVWFPSQPRGPSCSANVAIMFRLGAAFARHGGCRRGPHSTSRGVTELTPPTPPHTHTHGRRPGQLGMVNGLSASCM